MQNNFFLHQIRRTSGSFDKGIVIKDLERHEGETDEELSRRNYEAAKQGYHAYLGTYAYGQNNETDFVSCFITDTFGAILMSETWNKTE